MKRLPLVSLLLCLQTPSCLAADWGPWEVPQQKPTTSAASNAPLQSAVRFFQKTISPVDGPRCPMYPTCSAYALQALRKHGPLLGVFQTVDRLYREGDATHEHGRPISKYGYLRFYDPLEENDFWLK